jgi:hypothetical protein
MQTSSAPQAAAETEAVSLQTNLLALTLAIELARSADGEGGSAAPAAPAVRHLHELLEDETHQIGGGPGLRRAVEELQRALRQAGEARRRRRSAARAGSRARAGRPLRTEGSKRR